MYKKAQHTIATHKLIDNGDSIVVGVSGGADSLALLEALVMVGKRKNLTLTVAHVLYGVRPRAEVLADCQRVKARAEHHGLRFAQKDYNEISDKASSEDDLRKLRYEFFQSLAQEIGADSIAVGHTRDDLVETFFLHLLRGAGLAGLAALRYRRDNIIRPLLDITRAEVEEFCAKHEIQFGTDPTNADQFYTRNRIRHTLLPLLQEQFNPNIAAVITRTAQNIGDDYAFIRAQTDAQMIAHTLEGDTLTFGATDFGKLDTAIARATLHEFAQKLTNSPQSPLSFGTCEQIRTAIASAKNKSHQIVTSALIFRRNGDKIQLMRSS